MTADRRTRVTHETPCPACGHVETRETYDIGDGPELSCSLCEWCWGANGQPLTMQPIEHMREVIERHSRRDLGADDD